MSTLKSPEQADAQAVAAFLFPATHGGPLRDLRGDDWLSDRSTLTERLTQLPHETLREFARALKEQPDRESGMTLGPTLMAKTGQIALDWLDSGPGAATSASERDSADDARRLADTLAFRDILQAVDRRGNTVTSWASYLRDLHVFLTQHREREQRRGHTVADGPSGYLGASGTDVAAARAYILASFVLGNYVGHFTAAPVDNEIIAVLIRHHRDPDRVLATVAERGTADPQVLAEALDAPAPLAGGAL